ncbi:MAG: hypothetical protein ACKPFA_39310 [Dolichospermum sp.]
MPEYGVVTGTVLFGIFTPNSINLTVFIALNDFAMVDSLICFCPDTGETTEVIISGM